MQRAKIVIGSAGSIAAAFLALATTALATEPERQWRVVQEPGLQTLFAESGVR